MAGRWGRQSGAVVGEGGGKGGRGRGGLWAAGEKGGEPAAPALLACLLPPSATHALCSLFKLLPVCMLLTASQAFSPSLMLLLLHALSLPFSLKIAYMPIYEEDQLSPLLVCHILSEGRSVTSSLSISILSKERIREAAEKEQNGTAHQGMRRSSPGLWWWAW